MFRSKLPYFVLWLVASLSFAAAAKYKVCTVTINSKEEREVFKAKLKPADFEFVELTEFATDKANKTEDWFENACKQGVRCDVLVVSGHFGGEFFGSSGFKLGLNDLNKYSCYNRCDGIMSHPKEVYLFGCNTLATKDKDHRDENSYLEVLVRDGIDRTEAERRVAARYGPFGSSFKDQVERSFENVPLIYGFTSVGPAGAHVKGSLTNYLSQIGDFKKHLDAVNYEVKDNPAFRQTMGRYPIAIGKGLSRASRVYKIKENSCVFTDEQKPVHARLELAVNLLSSDPYIYLPTVSHFVNSVLGPNRYISSDTDRVITERAAAQIAGRRDLADLVLKNARSESVSTGIRVDLYKTARNLKWLSDEEFNLEIRALLDPLLKNPTTANADLVCSLIYADTSFVDYVSEELLLSYKFDQVAMFRLMECAGNRNTKLTRAALDGALRLRRNLRDGVQIFQLLDALNSANGYSSEILAFAKTFSGYRGANQNEISELLSSMTVQKGVGAEQIRAVERAAATKDIWDFISLVEDITKNERVETRSSLILLDRLIQFPAVELTPFYLSSMGTFFAQTDEFEKALAARWDRIPLQLIYKLNPAFLNLPKFRTAELRSKIIRHFLNAPHTLLQNPHFFQPFAYSALSRGEIEELREISRRFQLISNQMDESFRHIFYQQAIAGRVEMTDELLTGRKSKFKCEDLGPRGTSCGPEYY